MAIQISEYNLFTKRKLFYIILETICKSIPGKLTRISTKMSSLLETYYGTDGRVYPIFSGNGDKAVLNSEDVGIAFNNYYVLAANKYCA